MNNKIIPPFVKMCMSIGSLPTAFTESLSYYEALCWFVSYLNETVIPTINNNGEAVTELQQKFIELQNYVNNYFTNLDVQQEINNKLDEMAEDGTLANILSNYTNIAKIYDTVQDMIEDTTIINNQKILCLGYDTKTDGNTHLFTISTEQGENSIKLNNNLYANIVPNNIMKVHCIEQSAATFIIEFPNGKNMFIDTGLESQWAYIKLAIDTLKINKFDYGIITHFHVDHKGNIENFYNTYDLSECQIFIQMRPDFENHSNEIQETPEEWDLYVNTIKNLGLNPVTPENDSYLQITENIKLHFLNTSPTLAENYYGRQAEYYTDNKINFNAFSLITEIIHNDIKILSCGDSEKPTEEVYANYIGHQNLLIMPHHGVNESCYIPFYQAIHPDYSLFSYVTTPNERWIGILHEGFMTVKNLNSKLLTYAWTKAPNNIITFYSDGNILYNNSYGEPLGNQTPSSDWINGQLYRNLSQICDYSKYMQLPQNITLQNVFQNMDVGSQLEFIWYHSYTTQYPQLYQDILNIFNSPLMYETNIVTLKRFNTNDFFIKITAENVYYQAYQIDGGRWRMQGNGLASTLTNTSLITYVKKLPIGQYVCPYYKDSTVADMGNDSYVLTINIIQSGENVLASITAQLRAATTAPTASAKYLIGYINGNNYSLNKVI